jgi:hypothetical protein
MKGTYLNRESVYNRGCCGNWASVLMDPVPPSLFDASEVVAGAEGFDSRNDIELGEGGECGGMRGGREEGRERRCVCVYVCVCVCHAGLCCVSD